MASNDWRSPSFGPQSNASGRLTPSMTRFVFVVFYTSIRFDQNKQKNIVPEFLFFFSPAEKEINTIGSTDNSAAATLGILQKKKKAQH
jgi:hypothetical protein